MIITFLDADIVLLFFLNFGLIKLDYIAVSDIIFNAE